MSKYIYLYNFIVCLEETYKISFDKENLQIKIMYISNHEEILQYSNPDEFEKSRELIIKYFGDNLW